MTRREAHATDREQGREWMLERITGILKDWKDIDRCGIGFGGPVDFPRQRVALSTHVGGWRDFELSRYVQDLLCVPTVMDNDANLGALGEARYGAGGVFPLFCVTLSTGVGGGLILGDGSVYRGADSWAGEIGHLTVQPDGPECLCGARGCLERMCSGLWLEQEHGRPAGEVIPRPGRR